MVKLAEHLLRKNPSHVTLLSPLVTYLFTFVAGTGHVAYSVLPVIAEVATETKIRPERPLGIAVIASQQAITASPISAATVALLGLLAGFDITLFDILKITIPATIVGVLVGALFSMKVGKELVEDPEYQKRLKEGLFNNISFKLRKGEILGVAGLMGAGRTEIMRALFGVDSCKHGEVYLHGKKVCIQKPEDAIKAGIGFITENRKSEGLILDFSISRNIALPSVDTFAKRSVINAKNETAFSEALSKKLGVKTASIDLEAGALSGGNQQKVVIAKWIGMNPSIIIMDEFCRLFRSSDTPSAVASYVQF